MLQYVTTLKYVVQFYILKCLKVHEHGVSFVSAYYLISCSVTSAVIELNVFTCGD